MNSALKIRQFNISHDEFGWEMTKLLWKDFKKLLLSKKLFYFQTSEEGGVDKNARPEDFFLLIANDST